VVTIGYVGSRGRALTMALPDINRSLPNGSSPAIPRPFAVTAPRISGIGYLTPQGNSEYDALQLSFNRRLSAGLSFTSGFTFAHSMDNVTGIGTSTGGYGNLIGPFSEAVENVRSYDWANSDFYIRKRFTLGASYDLPFGRSLTGVAGHALGGWQMNGSVSWQTGLPFTVTDQTAVSGIIGVGGNAERPMLLRDDIRVSNPTVGSAGQFLDPAAFALPATGALGNAPRNIGFGPNQSVVNLSLFKSFRLTESMNLQFRTETFNLANHPIFDRPQSNFGNPNFGKVTAVAPGYSPRQIQFALKLIF
jgi:hypothetical protein